MGVYQTEIQIITLHSEGAALKLNTTGVSNTSIGNSSMLNNTVGIGNVAVGNAALAFNTSGFNNVALGVRSLYSEIQPVILMLDLAIKQGTTTKTGDR